MKSKQRPVVLLAMATLFAVAACSNGAGTETESEEVALILGTQGSPFFEAVECGAKDAAEELGINLTVSAPDRFDPDEQIPVIQAVRARQPAVAIATATDAQALIRPINELAESGTDVIMYDQTIADDTNVTAQIISDNYKGGQLAAEALVEAMGEDGVVMTIAAPPGSAAEDARTQGFNDAIAEYPGIENLGPQHHANDPQRVAGYVTSTLAANPDLSGVFGTGDQGVIGILTGLQQAGTAGENVEVVGYDAAAAEVDALKNGELAALVVQNPREFGELGVRAAKSLIDGEEIEAELESELVVVKRGENDKADEYEYQGDC